MKKKNILLIILIVISLVLIGGGVYLYMQTKPDKIIGKVLETYTNSVKNIVKVERPIPLTDSFKMTGDVKFTYSMDPASEYIQSKSIFDNLTKLKTNFEISQDIEKEEILLKLNSTMNNNKLANIKYYLKDSTGYYYNESVTNKYINMGSNNFFENIKESTSTQENINYLVDIINKSVKENLTENYIKTSTGKTKYNNKEVNANIITIELNNKELNKIIENIIKNLKEDEKSKEILTNYYEDFSKYKYTTQDILGDKTLKINIYTTGIYSKFIKIDLEYDIEKYELENINDNLLVLKILENDSIKYTVNIKKENDNKYNLVVKNNKNEKIGYINYNNTKKEFIIELSLLIDEYRYDIEFTDKYKNVKESSFDEKINLNLEYFNDNSNELTINISLDNKVTKNVKINEDTTSSVLEKSLTEQEKQKNEEYLSNLLLLIMLGA